MKTKDFKPHIGIFGRRNNGKSSLINLLTGEYTAIVSDYPGTTTDPVKKSVEIFGIGPAVIIDTAGIDDEGDLGSMRIAKTIQVIPTVDMAILIVTENTWGICEEKLLAEFTVFDIPYIIIHNKSDIEALNHDFTSRILQKYNSDILEFSTNSSSKIAQLVERMKATMPDSVFIKPSLFEGIVQPKDLVLLVTPLDSEAPEGRMILPQVMAWRDVLDHDCLCMSVKETELEDFFRLGIRPALVVTDSQAFDYVSRIVPDEIMLTGFSVLFSRLKGDFDTFLKGTPHIDQLNDGDRILILESCTHHVCCDDIGRHKIPSWLEKHTGKQLQFDIVPGLSQIEKPVHSYSMVIQCGGCMVTRKQFTTRLKPFIQAGIPVTNYGMTIAWINCIFQRVTQPFNTL